MSTAIYNCPCCGAPLTWNEGKLACASCGNVYDAEQLEMLNAAEESEISFAHADTAYSQGDTAEMVAYLCKNCGAELVTDSTTTATECPYCGSPTVLPAQLDNSVKPELVVPFKVTKEEAQNSFEAYFTGKKLMPNIFLNSRNRIAEIKKLYVPYWLFDCAADAEIVYDAEKEHTTTDGEWKVKTVEHYLLHRAGSMVFEKIPVDGSRKLDDKLGESLEPYDLKSAVPFQPAVLVGAMADRADVEAEECQKRAVERVEHSVEETYLRTTSGYSGVKVRSKRIRSHDGKAMPSLLPVWMISTEKVEKGEKKVYTFAINGQTGALTCDVKPDKKKSFAWFFGLFFGVSAVGYAILAALGMLGVIQTATPFAPASAWLLILGMLALVIAFVAVGIMSAQLRTAEMKNSAVNYIKQDSVQYRIKRDYYLYKTESRTKINKEA